MSLPTLSSEERLRRSPFLTVLMTHHRVRGPPQHFKPTDLTILPAGVLPLPSIDRLNLPPEDAMPDERMPWPLECSWGTRDTPAEIVDG